MGTMDRESVGDGDWWISERSVRGMMDRLKISDGSGG